MIKKFVIEPHPKNSMYYAIAVMKSDGSYDASQSPLFSTKEEAEASAREFNKEDEQVPLD